MAMSRLAVQLRESLGAFQDVFRNPGLRRLQLAFLGSEIGGWAYVIAIAVLAFEENGAAGVGLLLLIRLLPAAIAAPFTSILGDRYDRVRVMLSADLICAAAMTGAAVVAFAGAPIEILYAIAALASVTGTAFRPAQAAIMPSLSRTPDELTAANVTSSTIESATSFVGPAVGGVLLAATEPGVAFAVTAATFLWSAALTSRIRVIEEGAPAGAAREESAWHTVTAGIRTIAVEPSVRLLVALFGAQSIVAGALEVLVVVVALDLLDAGERGLGALNAALGIGGLLGAVGALALVGRRRLATAFGAGTMLWGAPIALMAASETTAVALLLLGLVGLANTVVDVAGYTLLQRAVPDEVLARVFGALETVFLGAGALGAVIASVLVEGTTIKVALVVTGLFLPAVALLAWRGITRIDEESLPPAAELLDLLRGIPFLALLPGPALEELASRLVPVAVTAGSHIIRQGDPGDRFYVIEEGKADVLIDGRFVRTLVPGEYFGEIALLRDVPRTATVTASTDLALRALERDDFIAAVTGHAPSARAAGAVVSARLGTTRTGRGHV
jgi:MFS family permease